MKVDRITEEATNWYIQLNASDASDRDIQNCRLWREASSAHETAWQEIVQLTAELKEFSSERGMKRTLQRLYDKPVSAERRSTLKRLAILLAAGPISYYTYKQQPWQGLIADYCTGVGEFREIALADGTQLSLNTSTALNIDYNESQRYLTLLKGEVLIKTGHVNDIPHRPFIVKTEHGETTALGTHFGMRVQNEFSSIFLLDGKVKAQPKHGDNAFLLNTGESLHFNAHDMLERGLADFTSVAWARGFIIADQMPLATLLSELGRYSTSIVQCDERVSAIRVSGSFSTDMEKALNMLTHKLPIRVQTFTRYWLKITPV